MSKKIVINIKNCNDCPHVDHSGGFTPGGAKDTCGNGNTCMVRANIHTDEPYHWIHRVLKEDKNGKLIIPDWCPL